MASYNLIDKEFTCTGMITHFRLCNQRSGTYLGLSVRRKDAMEMDIRVQYASNAHGFVRFHRQISFNGGDQLMFMVIYYPSADGTAHVDKRYVKPTIMACSIVNDIAVH